MDSKYTSFGTSGSNKKFTFCLKRPLDPPKVKSKKKKKKEETQGPQPSTSILVKTLKPVVPAIVENGIKKPENILEERKKLPVFLVRSRLLEIIKKNTTMIIIGETGSGKTTQIPQMIHEARLEGVGMVGVTQPRRVAAITIAMRVAKEMNTTIGDIVGYSVRFEDVTSNRTKVKYLTDGMLLREAMGDSLLTKYSVLVLDEAHERTVSTDVLFGIVKMAQKERKEKNSTPLKVIIMSATMDVDSFRSYFDECPVFYLEGRTHPVRIHHTKHKQDNYEHSVLCAIFQLHKNTPIDHDFLVFLTGQEEIESLTFNIKQVVMANNSAPIKVSPLYAGLPHNKQLEVWKTTPPGMRKVVLATNIAETSVTIPNIKCVIDTGFVKERTWCAATGAERLRVTACARASAWQRAGRAGRDAPGAAYRLYTAADLASRPAHQTPEILRCPLSSTVLWMLAVGIEPKSFPLLSPPPEESIQAALTLLQQLGATDNSSPPKLTVLGKRMAAFPIDPKYSKVILSANEYGCLDEALSIVAVLSSENIFHSSVHKREEALKAKQKFVSPLGDHITLLNVYQAFSRAPLKKQWCKEHYVQHRSLSHASDVRRQLAALCQRFHLTHSTCGASDQVLKCLLAGMWTQCAWWRGEGRYVTADGAAACVHPASVLHGLRPAPRALLYTELLTTHRTWMAGVSVVKPEWLQAGKHAKVSGLLNGNVRSK